MMLEWINAIFLPRGGDPALWTEDNLVQLKESKINYVIFTRSRQEFATRLTENNKLIERQEYVQLISEWLQPDSGWRKQVKEQCKKAYRRMSFLTKLRYAEVCHKQFIRTALEYCFVAIHSSLTEAQSSSLELCQAVALRVVLQDNNLSDELALISTGLEKLYTRRAACFFHKFSLKCYRP